MTDYNKEIRDLEGSKRTIGLQKAFPQKKRVKMVSSINKDIQAVKKTKAADLAGQKRYENALRAQERQKAAQEGQAQREEALYSRAMAVEKASELAQEKKQQVAEEKAYDAAMAQEKKQELAAEKAQNTSVIREAGFMKANEKDRLKRKQGREEWVSKKERQVGGILTKGEGVAGTVLKGLGKLAGKKLRVRHPDTLIDPKARFLYLPTNPKMTPLGHFMDNPMELYFGSKRTRSVPPSARVVLSALQQGYSPEQLEVMTGLSQVEINQGLKYLVDKKLISKEVLE